MPKYWVKNYFAHGRFPEVGQKQKTEKKKKEKDRKLVITMAKLRMAHASTHGACKPPGPKVKRRPYSPTLSIYNEELGCIIQSYFNLPKIIHATK